MDGNKESKLEVICCFCGEIMNIEEATILLVFSDITKEEGQQLFCHKQHLIEKLDDVIILYNL